MGVGGADAEIAFVDAAAGTAMHARLVGTTWSVPTTVGGSGLTDGRHRQRALRALDDIEKLVGRYGAALVFAGPWR